MTMAPAMAMTKAMRMRMRMRMAMAMAMTMAMTMTCESDRQTNVASRSGRTARCRRGLGLGLDLAPLGLHRGEAGCGGGVERLEEPPQGAVAAQELEPDGSALFAEGRAGHELRLLVCVASKEER